MNDVVIQIDPLQAFYIAGGLLLLSVAIFVYPTMKYGPRRPSKKKK